MKKAILLTTALVCLLFAGAFAESNLYYNAERGEWVEFVPQAEGRTDDAPQAGTVTDENGFAAGYLRVSKGTILYRDAERREPWAEPTEPTVFYAVRSRVYDKGCLYELRFDTPSTVDKEKYLKAYFYTRKPEVVDAGTALGEIQSARKADGAAIPVVRLYYDVDPAPKDSGYNIVSAGGEGWTIHDGVNLRKGPGRSFDYIVRLKKGAKVAIQGQTVNGVGATWLYVRDEDGNVGFISPDMITRVKETPVPTPTPTPVPEGTPDPAIFEIRRSEEVALHDEQPEDLNGAEETDGEEEVAEAADEADAAAEAEETLINEETAAETETPDEEAEPEEEDREVILAKGDTDLRLRNDGLSEIITTVASGTELTVLAVDGDWIRVEAGGVEGWVYKGSAEGLVSEEPEEEKAYKPKKVTIFTSRRMQMSPGDPITLSSVLEGFEDCAAIKYQWECDKGDGFKPVDGGSGETYTFPASVESLSWGWHLRVFYK